CMRFHDNGVSGQLSTPASTALGHRRRSPRLSPPIAAYRMVAAWYRTAYQCITMQGSMGSDAQPGPKLSACIAGRMAVLAYGPAMVGSTVGSLAGGGEGWVIFGRRLLAGG